MRRTDRRQLYKKTHSAPPKIKSFAKTCCHIFLLFTRKEKLNQSIDAAAPLDYSKGASVGECGANGPNCTCNCATVLSYGTLQHFRTNDFYE